MASLRETEPRQRAAQVSVESPTTTGSPFELRPGTIVAGRYRVVRLVGRGGMGAVYEAHEDSLGRRVALKLLHPIHATDPQVAARFVEEAKVANRVRHPALVEVTDRGLYEGRPFLVMEHLDGETLAARLAREGTFEPVDAIELLAPVFAAVSVLHDRGVVHRDLKPDNIFLAHAGDVTSARVLDLGVARVLDEDRRLTAADTVLGTPVYMAPEQIKRSRDATPRADQYALGCVVYEMLTGRVPFDADNLHGILVAKVTEEPVPVRTHRPSLPEPFAAAIMRALERDPARRFAHVSAFATALREGLAREALPATVSPPKRRALNRAVVISVLLALATFVTWWNTRDLPRTAPPALRVNAPPPPQATTPSAPARPAAESPTLPPTAPPRHRDAPSLRPRTPPDRRLDIDRHNPLRGARP